MNRFLTVGVLSAALAACVGPVETGSSSSQANSQSSTPAQSSTSVALSSSSSVSVSSSSVSSQLSSSSSMAGVVGDPVRGKTLMLGSGGAQGKCSGCHTDPDGDGYISGPVGEIDPDALGTPSNSAAYTPNLVNLTSYIQTFMGPLANGCDAQCAADIASYIWSTRDGIKGPNVAAAACELDEADIRYGTRALKVLTKVEYINSLRALFSGNLPKDYSGDIGADNKQKGFPNNIDLLITDDYFDRYETVAGQLATWALDNPSSLGFSCTEASACAQAFTQGFAAKAFRRPLTAEEVASYTEVITTASSPSVGLEWALRSVLSAPQFLYRSELGRTVAAALADEPAMDNAPAPIPSGDSISVGEPSQEFEMQNATYDAQGFATYGDNDYKGASVDASIFTGSDAISIDVVGTGTVGLNAKGAQIFTMNVNNSSPVTYTFALPEGNQNNYVQTFTGNGSSGIKISRVKIGPALTGSTGGGGVTAPPAELPADKLARADANAYVLDAYEYASALSYFLTASSPDDELMAAAASGAIFDPIELDAQVDRLLDSALGREQVGRFAGMWFGTDVIESKAVTPRDGNPAFTDQVRESMAQEIREIFKESFYSEGDFLDIYRGDFTMLDKTLSDYYGLPGGGSQHMSFQRVSTVGSNRGGIFASGAYMATYADLDRTSPVRRSVHFRQEILCQDVPPPSSLGADELDRTEKLEAANLIRDDGMGTEAEYFTVVTSPAACDACHKLIINPLFAVDDFDRFGRLHERRSGEIYQTAMTYFTEVLDQNGNPQLDNNGNPIFEANLGEAVVNSVTVNEGGMLYGGFEVGSIGKSAENDAESGTGIPFTGAKELANAVAERNLPGLEACLIDRSARMAFGEPLDERLIDQNVGRSDEEQLNFNCVKSDVSEAYSASGNSTRAVFKALATSDALLFRK